MEQKLNSACPVIKKITKEVLIPTAALFKMYNIFKNISILILDKFIIGMILISLKDGRSIQKFLTKGQKVYGYDIGVTNMFYTDIALRVNIIFLQFELTEFEVALLINGNKCNAINRGIDYKHTNCSQVLYLLITFTFILTICHNSVSPQYSPVSQMQIITNRCLNLVQNFTQIPNVASV